MSRCMIQYKLKRYMKKLSDFSLFVVSTFVSISLDVSARCVMSLMVLCSGSDVRQS